MEVLFQQELLLCEWIVRVDVVQSFQKFLAMTGMIHIIYGILAISEPFVYKLVAGLYELITCLA